MIDLKPGVLGAQKQFTAVAESARFNCSAERNKEFITILLGVKHKKESFPTQRQLEAMLFDLGYVTQEDIVKQLGKKNAREILKGIKGELEAEVNK